MKKDLFTAVVADAEIEYPGHREVVQTAEECSRRCRLLGAARCRGYSVKPVLNASGNQTGVFCSIPDEGTLYFVNSTGGSLFHSKT
jgi:hypothetical protein